MPKMRVSYKRFPSGTVLRKIGTVTASKKKKEDLNAPLRFKKGKHTYDFLFWDENASLHKDRHLTFTTPDDNSSFAVDAWYVKEGSNGGTGVTTYAFSLNHHKTVPDTTPIASVNCPGAWAGAPSTKVSTTVCTTPVKIRALDNSIADKTTGYGLFNSWLQFCTKGSTVSGKVLKVPAKGGGFAIAFYGIPVPDPCQIFRDRIAAGCAELPPKECQKLIAALNKQLKACEGEYGETPLPPAS